MDWLLNKIADRKWKSKIVSAYHLEDLRRIIIGLRDGMLLDETFYYDQLTSFSFDPPDDLPGTRSIIITAVPAPQVRIFFTWKGRRVPVIIPPTYVSYSTRTMLTKEFLACQLTPGGYHIKNAELPLKILAVYSGLAKYGRNNISYVNGMGSFFQLVGTFTDLPCDRDSWQEPQMLDQCGKCVACLKQCPAGAIGNDRFLLHAERCLTWHNESRADFPEWIDPSWHHCFVGCMKCQLPCPANIAVKNWYEDRAVFSEEETAIFVRGVAADRIPEGMAAKIKSLEINEKLSSLSRNLSMMIKTD